MTTVAVVGSANLDLVCETSYLPSAGETTIGTTYGEHPGGKGVNQALDASALATTALVCSIGRDAAGKLLTETLHEAGVSMAGVASSAPTGRAIVLLSDGDNRIVVVPGANADLGPETVLAQLDSLDPTVVSAVLEVPAETVAAAADWADAHGRRFIVNASPASNMPAGSVGERIVTRADPLIVNRGEAEALLDVPVGGDVASLAATLAQSARSAVVTDGRHGSYVATPDGNVQVPAPEVNVRDTTGAGDAFAGTLAAALALGSDLATAARRATDSAALVVTTDRDSRVTVRD